MSVNREQQLHINMAGYQLIAGKDRLENARIGIVASRYNSHIVDRLLTASIAVLVKAGISEKDILVVHVPGAFEIPVAVQRLVLKKECEAVIALGAIIRGETPHFDYIARECSQGLARIALNQDVPVIFGVLTVDNTEQAMDRSGDEESNKGAEAAQAAVQMINVMRKI
jgi:6,7-dimethyl-8-ribityllumazine synthase